MNYTFFFTALLIPALAFSQTLKTNPDLFEDIPTAYIQLKNEKKQQKILLPFKEIKVLDYRNDISVAGITHFETFRGNGNYNTKYYKFSRPAVDEIGNYLLGITELNNNSSEELVMIIRRIWIGSEFENKSIQDNDRRMQTPYIGGVRTTFEFYAFKDNMYVPIKRFDTTIADIKMKENEAEQYLTDCIKASVISISSIKINDRMANGRKLSFATIDSFSSTLRNLNLFTIKNPERGVYISYEEFKNNKPSIKDFEIKKTSQAHSLYVKDESGNEFPIHKIWGFCDGTRFFIQGAYAFFELEYCNETFYCWGAKKIDMTYTIMKPFRGTGIGGSGITGAISQSLRKSSRYKLLVKLMQLDLETGVLY